MVTKRSLNKLEFKAHMSIHNTVEVADSSEPLDTSGARDRFGKRHPMVKNDENY